MKLNKTNREEIISHCIVHTFKQAEADVKAARSALADALYDHALGAEEKIAKKLPARWLAKTSRIEITCEGFYWSQTNRKDTANSRLMLSTPRLEPNTITDEFTVREGHPLFEQAQSVVRMELALGAGKEQLKQRLMTLLASVTSTEKLREAWPEGAKFLPDEPVRGAALPVPANLTREVNAMMGLKAA